MPLVELGFVPVSSSAPQFDDLPQIGDVLDNKYVVESLLGAGGMGAVYSARDQDLGQPVAIKLLLPQVAHDPQMVARFLREAQAAAAIQNDHVVRVFSVGKTNTGVPFMVMEFLSGIGLDELIRTRGPVPVSEAVDLVAEACRALGHAHALGIVHRDIKPSNLFLCSCPDGSQRLKVLDFGISKLIPVLDTPAHEHDLTSTVQVLGTPIYMSPEQARSAKAVTAATDIWALGVVLYELLCGQAPFTADTLSALIAQIVADNPVSPSKRRADVPVALGQLVMHCLEKLPERRPDSISEIARRLRPYASPRGVAHIDIVCGNTDPGSLPTALRLDVQSVTLPHLASRVTTARRGRWLAVVVGASALLALGVSVGLLLSMRPAPAINPDGEVSSAIIPSSPLPSAALVPSASASPLVSASASAPPPTSNAVPSKTEPIVRPVRPVNTKQPPEPPPSAPSSTPSKLDPFDRY